MNHRSAGTDISGKFRRPNAVPHSNPSSAFVGPTLMSTRAAVNPVESSSSRLIAVCVGGAQKGSTDLPEWAGRSAKTSTGLHIPYCLLRIRTLFYIAIFLCRPGSSAEWLAKLAELVEQKHQAICSRYIYPVVAVAYLVTHRVAMVC